MLGLMGVAPPSSAADVSTSGTTALQRGDDSVGGSIVGGVDANIEDAPWQVALLYASPDNDFESKFCGGSIISAEWILTAAHCLVDEYDGVTKPAEAVNVVAGTSYLRKDYAATRLPVADVYVHPSYDWKDLGVFDVALLRLAAPLSFSDAIAPIQLPYQLTPAQWPADETPALIRLIGFPGG